MTARSVTDDFWDLAVASAAETAEALGMTVDSVYEAVARGDIPADRWGRRIVVKVQTLKSQIGADGAEQ